MMRARMDRKTARRVLAVLIITAVLIGTAALPASAAALAAAPDTARLNAVMTNITEWLTALTGGLATLLAAVGGVRYMIAAGDPGEVLKAKETLKYAAIGYAIAALASVLYGILASFVA
jgi:hypothetical protein